jgi:hypothetical protein
MLNLRRPGELAKMRRIRATLDALHIEYNLIVVT